MSAHSGRSEPTQAELIAFLSRYVTEQRLARMREVLDERTRYITVCVEDVYQSHNASAVLRSCDACGVQDVHIIENRNSYNTNPDVELGSAQWLTLQRHTGAEFNTIAAFDELRERGYRIVATTPHHDPVTLDRFSLDAGPVALVFGNELEGLTPEAVAAADEHLRIPMVGFVESFNVSVSAAICLHKLAFELRESTLPWRLSDTEKQTLLLQWLRTSVRRWHSLERAFRRPR